jgi:putative endonuclease
MKPRYRIMLRKMEVRENKIPAEASASTWSLYILRCCDGSFFTGVTIDIDRRFREHEDGRTS